MDPKKKTVFQALGVIGTMGALAWAAVPAYNYFCAVTGFGGVTQQADAGSDHILDRTIKVRFDASTERDMAWDFKPVQRQVELKIGETGLAFYEAHNPTDRPIAGQASYNVTPYEAGGFFTKIDCFCFTEQVLMPGETVEMPVTFYVDPEMVEDRDAKYIHTITLGYTFYEIDMPEGYAADHAALLDGQAPQTDVN
ncbi:Cytochrome c oxidase assembly protein CtaG [Pseudooceanicola marinus]|uniref:Cytochrome c oxidase assembly protein CtaG n=1 Tax=Pseudooceanicola marinus TaxID=396013 RepID=A0A1X6Z0K9_9RHOB|nr:cytochrome c oxidase assembly protein [Pseudooceanicola marinus]PJE32509.1 cytochrome c oxidase assembly protein [Pseudooceanicola marinus]SLN36706.1 Cytochrome c oxidase assembly protein CtaG [Pseudooceanicola marinus]